MPELPEVETVRAGLVPVLEGRTIVDALTRRSDLRTPFPPKFASRLRGQRVVRLARRAKYILAELNGGETLVVHLGMSGRISVHSDAHATHKAAQGPAGESAGSGSGKHDHVLIRTDAPALIVFTDHRRFGLMTLIESASLHQHPLFRSLGIEPLSETFNATVLSTLLRKKATSIKTALLDQRVVAGLGNIYVCEALFRARLSPRRRASTVAGDRSRPLAAAIRAVLLSAIKAGGSSLRDHKRVDGELGEFQHRFAVYDREGRPCPNRCGGTIRRIVQSGRSTFYCPRCQR